MQFVLAIYQNFFSSAIRILLGPGCRFTPTCSEYARQSISKKGIVHGTISTVRRILRCHPGNPGGFDPVQ